MVRRVVITGIGAVTPIGNNQSELWAAVKDGICGIDKIRAYDTTGRTVTLAAEVKMDTTTVIPEREARKMDRYTVLGIIASREAYEDSGLAKSDFDKKRAGIIISSGIGGLYTIAAEYSRGLERGFDKVSPFFIPKAIANIAAGIAAIETGFKGPCSSVVTACAGGTHAIGEGMRSIRHGYSDIMLCGGAEACVTDLAIGGFTSLRALHTGEDKDRASIPFDKERSGFVLGEGAGIVILEEHEHALARGAKIYAEVKGFGESCDAYHITAPDPSGEGAAAAMANAIADAGISPDDIDYINAHGTSTPLNDKCESLAIHKVFGKNTDVLVSSTKAMTGHMLGAAGAVEGIICAKAVYHGRPPVNINFRELDPECNLNIVVEETNLPLRHTLSNSFGFGGHNASLVISRWED